MTSSQYNANGRGHSRCRHHSSAKHRRRHLRRSPSPTTDTATRTATRVGCATRTRFPACQDTPRINMGGKREQLVRSRGGSDHHGMARAWGRAKPCVGRPSGALLWMLGRCKTARKDAGGSPGCVRALGRLCWAQQQDWASGDGGRVSNVGGMERARSCSLRACAETNKHRPAPRIYIARGR